MSVLEWILAVIIIYLIFSPPKYDPAIILKERLDVWAKTLDKKGK